MLFERLRREGAAKMNDIATIESGITSAKNAYARNGNQSERAAMSTRIPRHTNPLQATRQRSGKPPSERGDFVQQHPLQGHSDAGFRLSGTLLHSEAG